MVREAMSEQRNVQREIGNARREAMQAIRDRFGPNLANNGQNGGNNGNGGNGGGNNGNGPGRGGRGGFNPEVMKKAMEDPQVKAQMDQFRQQGQKLENQFATAINKILTARQRSMFKRMLGAPFDRSQLAWGGPGGRGGNRNPAAAKNAATTKSPQPRRRLLMQTMRKRKVQPQRQRPNRRLRLHTGKGRHDFAAEEPQGASRCAADGRQLIHPRGTESGRSTANCLPGITSVDAI